MSEAENSLEFAMSLIAYSGDAKSHAMEAIYAAKKNAFEEAEKKLKLAEVSLLEGTSYSNKYVNQRSAR
ncbi:PTS lactose/cellobiose transporter subunit IIA [Staphylococcus aureus]